MKNLAFIVLIISLIGCSSTANKVVLDTSASDKPDWVDSSKMVWKDEGKNFFRGSYTVRGDERANGCIDLAKLNVKEALITEIQEDLRGAVESAQDSIKTDAELLLTKSRSAQYEGEISGLRFTSSYWEKYALVNGEEKTSCYVLSEIEDKDYMKTKRRIVNKIVAANPGLKKAISENQINFFKKQ